MENKKIIYLIVVIACLISCNSDKAKKIELLISSDNIEDKILGSYLAGESGDECFVPYLLNNADDPSRSTSLRFKGFSVYQQKMIALKKILKVVPPKNITAYPDSLIIKFYNKAALKDSK